MKSISLICLMFACVDLASAQSLSPQVVASGGSYASAGGYSLSQTIGELSVQTATAGGSILTQGFQQPYPDQYVGISDPSNDGVSIGLYPNPAGSEIFVKIRSDKNENYHLKVSDVSGREIFTEQHLSTSIGAVYPIDLSNLSSGLYLLNVRTSENGFSKTIPFVKN